MAATLAAKLWLAWLYEGFLTGDDLEIVETAARTALGLRYDPWTLRCLFHPIVLASPFLKIASLFGVKDPDVFTWAAAIPTALFSTASIALTAALALRFGLSRRAAAAAAFFQAFAWMSLAYGASPFPRPISTALLLGAFLLATSPRHGLARPAAAGILAGAAFAVRWSEGIVLLPLLASPLLLRPSAPPRPLPRIAAIAGGFAAGSFLCAGITDWLTWGRPFESLWQYFRIMFLERPDVDNQPFWEYPYTILHWAGPILLLLLAAAWRVRRARLPIAFFACIVALMSLFSHKEWRYLQAAIPFLAIAAGAGWERLWAGRLRALAVAAMLLAAVHGIERSINLLSNRSSAGLAAARYLRSLDPKPKNLALLQRWAWGGRLYLGNDVEIREVAYSRPVRPDAIRAVAAEADAIGLYARLLDDADRRELETLGFREIARFRKRKSYECVVFARDRRTGADFPPRLSIPALYETRN
jgi:hypothetical protein